MDRLKIKNILESLLMWADKPLSIGQMMSVFEEEQHLNESDIMAGLDALETDYVTRAIELKQVASGYVIQTRTRYAPWISRLLVEKSGRYSRALLETLAIIAYRQPVTRADVEDVRGVSLSSSILKTLLERGWIKVAGQRDVPGKPAVYVTTREFLDYFSLSGIHQLPPLLVSEGSVPVEEDKVLEECYE